MYCTGQHKVFNCYTFSLDVKCMKWMDGWMVNHQAETLSVRYQVKYKSKRDLHELPHLLRVSKKVT